MQVEINSNGEKGTARKRAVVPRTAGLLMASWAILGSSAHAEVLYEKGLIYESSRPLTSPAIPGL